MRRLLKLEVFALLLAVSTLAVILEAPLPLRASATAVLILAPGYVATLLLFSGQALDWVRTALLTFTLGLSFAVIAALGLHLTVGLYTDAWVAVLDGSALGGYLLAVVFRRPGPPAPEVRMPALRARDLVLLSVGVAVTGVAVAYARTPLPATNANGYTALSLLPASHRNVVRIGVRSGELRTTRYRLVVRSGARVLFDGELPPIAAGTERVRLVRIPAKRSRIPVVAQLYRTQHPHVVYRRTRLFPLAR